MHWIGLFVWHIKIGWLKGMRTAWGASCLDDLTIVIVTENQFAKRVYVPYKQSKWLHLIQMKDFSLFHLDRFCCCWFLFLLSLNFRASDKIVEWNNWNTDRQKEWKYDRENETATWMILWTHKRMSCAQRLMKYEKSPIKCLQHTNNFQHMTNKNRLCRE